MQRRGNREPGSFRKQLRRVLERLELERVAGRVVEEHRRLLADLAGEADAGLDLKARAGGAQSRRKRFPRVPFEDHAEVRHGHVLTVDFVEVQRMLRRIEVRDELMAEEIEIDPLGRAATFRTTEHTTV